MLRREYGVGEVVVENGGDIYADVRRPLDVALFAGTSPLSERVGLHLPAGTHPLGICTSSGTVGPSLSFGRADAVMIVCRDVLLADSFATAYANRIRSEADVGPSSGGPAPNRTFWVRWPYWASGWPWAAGSNCGFSTPRKFFERPLQLTISQRKALLGFCFPDHARKYDISRPAEA